MLNFDWNISLLSINSSKTSDINVPCNKLFHTWKYMVYRQPRPDCVLDFQSNILAPGFILTSWFQILTDTRVDIIQPEKTCTI